MSKIYDGSIKLNHMQVIGAVTNEMPESHARQLKAKIMGNTYGRNYQRTVAHAILDAYRFLALTTEEEEKSKKMLKHLLDKYMKSQDAKTEENSAYKILLERINGTEDGTITEDEEEEE